MKKLETAGSRFNISVIFHYLMMAKETSLGFSSTPEEFFKKLPSKSAETHKQDREQMLNFDPEYHSSFKLNPFWEEERAKDLEESRRLLAAKFKELTSKKNLKS